MNSTENPGALAGATGAETAIHANAESLSNIAKNEAEGTSKFVDHITFRPADRIQMLYLRRLHGLTEAQAHAMAILVWGIGNG